MNYLKRYWWAVAIAFVAIYLFKPGWIKFNKATGPTGGPVGGTLDKPGEGTNGEF